MAGLILAGIGKQYGDMVALHPTDLRVSDGEFLTLLGPSGCGKTTLLRIIAGLVDPTSGRLSIDGENVTALAPQKRGIGVVFQDYALFPHMTVRENIGFGLKERRYSRAAIDARVEELLNLIKLPTIADRFPAEVSGGQQQRVAFARAIAHPPRILLMDEPLGALDLKLRESMQRELRHLTRQIGITTVYVTHDQSEAMYLSDQIAVMSNGRIEQIGSSRDIYERPTSRFVAEFVGQINLLPADFVARDGVFSVMRAAGADLRVRNEDRPVERGGYIAVRPHKISIASNGQSVVGRNSLQGRVVSQVFNGNIVHVQVDVGHSIIHVETRPSNEVYDTGSAVTVHWDTADASVLER
jgi:putative spermidine/putrescine transport system ATP-binding protein